MKKISNKSSSLAAVALVALAASLTACSSVGYRCPLDSSEKADSPTACAGMAQSLDAAKKGHGGKQSVLVDEKGRIVPDETTNKSSLQVIRGADEPYATPSGSPQYQQPKVFQAWTPAYIDKAGNLHDGRNSYFATPGEWRYGSVSNIRDSGGDVGSNLLRPSRAGDLPSGKLLPPVVPGAKKAAATATPAAAAPSDKVVLQNLSDSAQRAAASTPAPGSKQAAPGVTAPGVKLSD